MLGVVGCGPQPMPCGSTGTGGFGAAGPGGGFGGAGGGSTQPLGLVGKPMTVELAIPQLVTCGPGSTADDVTTEVLDPGNRPVAHTHGPVKSTMVLSFGFQQPGFGVDVTFTPLTSGSHHLAARFEPSLGSAQLDVDVAADRTGAPSKTLSLGVTCAALEVLPSGLTLCLDDNDRLLLFRDEMSLMQTVDADDFVAVGDKVWTTRFGLVKRWLDVGGPTPLAGALGRDTLLAERGTLVATEDTALFVATSGVVKLRATANALVEDARVYPPLIQGWVLYATPNPAHLLIATGSNFGGGQLCSVVVVNDAVAECMPFASTLLGADETGLWVNAGDSLSHYRWQGAADGGALARTSLVFHGLPLTPVPPRHFPATPALEVGGRNVVPKIGRAHV